jgi:hypothetical protein
VSAWNKDRYLFHDTKLSGIIEYARQALAIDEYRADYTPTLWTPDSQWPRDRLKQRWFIGAHGDVGGGYAVNQPLADFSLQWMVAEARAVGLACTVPTFSPSTLLAPITPTHARFLGGLYQWFSKPAPRPITELIEGETKLEFRNQDLDGSAVQRLLQDREYGARHAALRSLSPGDKPS